MHFATYIWRELSQMYLIIQGYVDSREQAINISTSLTLYPLEKQQSQRGYCRLKVTLI